MDQLLLPSPAAGGTPQKLHRRGAAKLWTRGRLDVYTLEHAALARSMHAARLLSDAPTPADLEGTLIQHLGYQYGFWDRCGGTHHEHDCSGYQCWGMNQIVRPLGCLSSFVIAQLCFDAGLMISYEEAQTVPCWAFHGADQGRRDDGSRPNGASGHIVYVNTMPGYGLSTLEAMGRAYGVRRGAFYGRGWTGFYRILGLNYSTASMRERDMIIQAHHYDAHGKITGPCKTSVPGEDAYWIPAADGSCMEGHNGASIANDQPTADRHKRTFTPKSLDGRKIVGATFRAADAIDAHDGISIALNDGHTLPGHFS